MSEIDFNLLDNPCIRMQLVDGGLVEKNLPGVLSSLMQDEVLSFPALRPHQEPMWHAFLVQLATIALLKAGIKDSAAIDKLNEEKWRDLLCRLTPGFEHDEPWCLCVSSLEAPAFLQPPLPQGLSKAKIAFTPDELDVLVTSKKHDVKGEQIRDGRADDWLFMLVSLQTQAGFDGRGNYGVVRMNGGYGTRTMLRIFPPGGIGAAVRRDIEVILKSISVEELEGKHLLLWLKPWNGKESLPYSIFHPLTIEVARVLRLENRGDGLCANKVPSDSRRIAAEDLNGNVGDYWLPVEQTDPPKAFSLTGQGFSYAVLSRLLFGERGRSYNLPLLAVTHSSDKGDLILCVSGLARGQGKTEGYHFRTVGVPKRSTQLLLDEKTLIASRSHEQIAQVGTIAGSVLRPALIILFQKGPEEVAWKKPSNDSLVAPYREKFDRKVDGVFFYHLWSWTEMRSETGEAEIAELDWERFLANAAQEVLSNAIEAAPLSVERRIIAVARAQEMFNAGLRKHLPRLFRKNLKQASKDYEDEKMEAV